MSVLKPILAADQQESKDLGAKSRQNRPQFAEHAVLSAQDVELSVEFTPIRAQRGPTRPQQANQAALQGHLDRSLSRLRPAMPVHVHVHSIQQLHGN